MLMSFPLTRGRGVQKTPFLSVAYGVELQRKVFILSMNTTVVSFPLWLCVHYSWCGELPYKVDRNNNNISDKGKGEGGQPGFQEALEIA